MNIRGTVNQNFNYVFMIPKQTGDESEIYINKLDKSGFLKLEIKENDDGQGYDSFIEFSEASSEEIPKRYLPDEIQTDDSSIVEALKSYLPDETETDDSSSEESPECPTGFTYCNNGKNKGFCVSNYEIKQRDYDNACNTLNSLFNFKRRKPILRGGKYYYKYEKYKN